MKNVLLILGNQLFPLKHLESIKFDGIIMFEDLGLCEHFKYHKHKIIFFLSAMRHYRDELKASGHKVFYEPADTPAFSQSFETKLKSFLESHPSVKSISHFEIEDKFFESRITNFLKANQIQQHTVNSPMFLSSRDNFAAYLKSVKKPFMNGNENV